MKIKKSQLIKLIREQEEIQLGNAGVNKEFESIMGKSPETKVFLMNLKNVLRTCPWLRNQQEKNNLYDYFINCLFANIDNSGFDKRIAARLTKVTEKIFDN